MQVGSILVELVQLKVERNFLKVSVVLGFGQIMKLECLLYVVDLIKLVNLLQVDQWNTFLSFNID